MCNRIPTALRPGDDQSPAADGLPLRNQQAAGRSVGEATWGRATGRKSPQSRGRATEREMADETTVAARIVDPAPRDMGAMESTG